MSALQFSDFEIIKKLGEGGFGSVYLAQKDGELLCLKQVELDDQNPDDVTAQLREADLLGKLKSPYIVQYKGMFIDQPPNSSQRSLFIMMEYASKGSLSSLIKSHKDRSEPFSEAQIWKVLFETSTGLQYIHSERVIHRDIKPENILIGSDGKIRIADLGIARVLSTHSSAASTRIGTPYYESPELIMGEKYAFPTDVWSLGAVVYLLCALRRPFEGKSPGQIVTNVVTQTPAPLPQLTDPAQKIPGHYSPKLCNLVQRMMEKDLSKRITADEIVSISTTAYKESSAEAAKLGLPVDFEEVGEIDPNSKTIEAATTTTTSTLTEGETLNSMATEPVTTISSTSFSTDSLTLSDASTTVVEDKTIQPDGIKIDRTRVQTTAPKRLHDKNQLTIDADSNIITHTSQNESSCIIYAKYSTGIAGVRFRLKKISADSFSPQFGILPSDAKTESKPEDKAASTGIAMLPNGNVIGKGHTLGANDPIKVGDYIGIELDLRSADPSKRIATFLINDKPQKVIVSGVPASVTFCVTFTGQSEAVQIEQVYLSREPTITYPAGTAPTPQALPAKTKKGCTIV